MALAENWTLALAAALAMLVLAPLATLVWLGVPRDGTLLAGSVRHVLYYALRDTLGLSLGVAVLTIMMGTTIAALVTFSEFPGRRLLSVAAVLPLALPTYLQAYILVEVQAQAEPFSAPLPLQHFWQAIALAMPELRSMPGAILVFSLVLFPYVYVAARVAFAAQGGSLFNAARTLGCSPLKAFLTVSLPLAGGPILAGALLAVMETLNDIGASEYLGVRTLAFTIYTTWLSRDDLAGAAQLSIGLVSIVMFLAYLARRITASSTRNPVSRAPRAMDRLKPRPVLAALFVVAGFAPVLAGFAVPVLFLCIRLVNDGIAPEAWRMLATSAGGSFIASFAAAAITVAAAVMLLVPDRLKPRHSAKAIGQVASYGYAIPGAVLALATFLPAGALDNLIDTFMRERFGVSTGLLLSGSLFLIVFGYCVRLLSVGHGIVKSAMDRAPRSLDMAARTLGRGPLGAFASVPLRLGIPAIAGALLLVFVDAVKELPLTLILRPLGFETLATSLYDAASRGEFEKGALQALVMVALGVVAAIAGSRFSQADTSGVARRDA